MPDETQVLFKSPSTGKVQVVPQESWEDQLAAGYTPVSHKVMYGPKGERSMVPNEELHDYVKQGYQTSLPTRFEQERSGGTVGNALKSMIPPDPTGGAPILSKEFWLGKTGNVTINPTAPGTAYSDITRPLPTAQGQQGTNLPTEVLGAGKTGGNAIYRGASLFSPAAGVSPESMEEASGRGATSEVATQAGVPAAAAIAGPLIGKTLGARVRAPLPEGAAGGISADTTGAAGRWVGSKTGIPGAGYVGEKIGRLFGNEGTVAGESAEDIQAALQQRRAAYAEMNEDFANRAKQQTADMQKRIAASEKRISAAEDARQKEITDWAKVDKINDADHQAFQDRMSEIEQERQKALADTEKLRTQHAQDLQQRGVQQQAMDDAHAQNLADVEKARQGDLAAQERLKEQHAAALNARKGAKAPPAPPPNPFAGMTSTAPGTALGNAPLPPAPTVSAPATIRMGTGIGSEGSAQTPATGRPGGLAPPPSPIPEPTGAPLSRPTIGSQIAAREKTSLLSRGTELYQAGREPDVTSAADMKQINDMTNWKKPRLETAAKNGDRFAAFVLRKLSGQASIRP